jgi:L-threonylcarbamoyladenylate synthase
MILDAGPVSVGIESTVVDLTTNVPTILRPGMISADDLRQVIGRVEIAAASAGEGVARPSPGMMERHYSPRAQLIVVDAEGLPAAIMKSANTRSVVLARTAVAGKPATVWQMPERPGDYARLLYSMLHRADAEGFGQVIVEAVPDGAAWDGVRDRLRRASRP